jgi:hypothetical protein
MPALGTGMIFRKRKYIFRDESHYQPSWFAALLALAAAMFLSWHSMVRADVPPPPAHAYSHTN